jgi:predicted AlkP superfamily pyrophosphatase or phosphodiesterase
MANRTAVIDLVALTDTQLQHMPRLTSLLTSGSRCRLQPPLPAVTCTSQSTMLTGSPPASHGIVGNGWYNRTTAETRLWQQSNHLVQGEKIWDRLRRMDPEITIANCFWWYAMYTDVDATVTPRPMYLADGRKMPDIWTAPSTLRDELQTKLGQFPLFRFWGPAADISGSRWIADAARHVDITIDPTLLLVYLPHLDYGLQKLGPTHPDMPRECRLLDELAADLIEDLQGRGRRILIVNEYGIAPVTGDVSPNRELRSHGFLQVRNEKGRELLDAGASRAFAIADHQIAHVYVSKNTSLPEVCECLAQLDGVDHVLVGESIKEAELDHERCGDIVLIATQGRWFSHDWWNDPDQAPDWQRTVEIHRKPGYDPRELFIDPAIRFPKFAIAWRLLKRRLGLRTLLDVIPLDASLVRGSHGRVDPDLDPLLWCSEDMPMPDRLPMTGVADLIEQLVLSE